MRSLITTQQAGQVLRRNKGIGVPAIKDTEATSGLETESFLLKEWLMLLMKYIIIPLSIRAPICAGGGGGVGLASGSL